MKTHKIKNAKDLSSLLGLSEADAVEAELKASVIKRIKLEVEKMDLTHQEIADIAGVGRTVITGIVNCSIQRITLDRLIRILVCLGVSPEIKYKKAA